MSHEYTTKTWTIEHDWKCNHCKTVNKGREDKCVSCGKPIDDTHEEIVPSDMSYENRVKDTEVFSDGKPDWICKYCSHRNRAVDSTCEECGASTTERKQTVSSGQETTPGTTISAPRKDSKGRPEFFTEYSHTSPDPEYIKNPEFEKEEKEEQAAAKERNEKTKDAAHYRTPTFQKTTEKQTYSKVVIQEIQEEKTSSGKKLLGPGLGFLGVALVIYFFYWMFSWHAGTAVISSTSWEYRVTTYQRSVQSGHSWQDQEPAHSFNETCSREIRSYHSCNPYDCNPHRVSYDCNCRSWRECSTTTSCRTVCTRSGNRSSSCSERCTPRTSCETRRSCSTCYRTEYDTCYRRCPDYDNMCSYQYPQWSPGRTAVLTGTNHTLVRPALQANSNLVCPSDPEQLYIANHSVSDCHKDTTTFAAVLDAGEHGTQNFTPSSLAEYNRYTTGATWNIEYNHAGQFRVLGPR
ncbi:MAG: hypothetical protein E6R04_02060 [Spirochaetes bacterium]|nr:MAG: hypothetical protein E6R04_02060 [Spirochaetota bacterium]